MKDKLKYKGEILEIGETKFKSKSNFKQVILKSKREDGSDNIVKFEVMNENIELFDNLKPKDKVEIDFLINGKEWKKDNGSKLYYIDLHVVGLKIIKLYTPLLFDEDSIKLSSPDAFENF
tara:strand:- start:35 stop:394 length:360 start_codon:yes stop_codon:yes gene_type:complete